MAKARNRPPDELTPVEREVARMRGETQKENKKPRRSDVERQGCARTVEDVAESD